MSNRTRFAVLVGVSVAAAVVVVLTSSFGAGLPLLGAALVAAVVAAIVATVLWKGRAPEPTVRRIGLTAPIVGGLALGVLALGVLLVVAEGEARDHGFLHYLFGVVHLVLFAAVGWTWRPEPGTGSSGLRGLLLVVLGVASAAAFLESIGAAGYDRFNAGDRIEWLTTVHGATAPVAAIGVLAIPAAVIAVVAALVGRSARTRSGR